MALVVESGIDARAVAEELAEEMESIGGVAVERILDAGDGEDLASRLATARGPVVSSGFDAWKAEEWATLDRLRSRFAREERTALVLGRPAFDLLLQEAPNFSSWLGASVVMYQPNASELDEEGRKRRLDTLRAWSGLTDEEILARATAGALPAEPEFAEWLVLLRRGDLLER